MVALPLTPIPRTIHGCSSDPSAVRSCVLDHLGEMAGGARRSPYPTERWTRKGRPSGGRRRPALASLSGVRESSGATADELCRLGLSWTPTGKCSFASLVTSSAAGCLTAYQVVVLHG